MHLPLGLLYFEAILGNRGKKKQKCNFSTRNGYFWNEISSQRSSITTCYDAVPGCPETPLGDQTEIHHCLPDQIMLNIRCIINNNNNNNNYNKISIKVTLSCGPQQPMEDQIKQRYIIVYQSSGLDSTVDIVDTYIGWIDKYCIRVCQFNKYIYKYWDGSVV